MIPLTLGEIAQAVDGALVVPPGWSDGSPAAAALVLDGPVVTDSRAAGPGGLYVARIGEHADGHDFVAAAASAGAVAALTSRPVAEVPSVVVPDVQVAFGALARAVLNRLPDLTVVAVTGSSGKTSTKDLLAQVLAPLGPVVAPENSLNGEIGVPLTVCRVTPQTRTLVVEMGARGIGHIDYLTGIAPPRIGVVLNVGTAHLGEFGSRKAIATAKGELVAALPAHGLAVLNADDPAVAAMASRTQARVVLVGLDSSAAVRATDIVLDAQGRPGFLVHTPGGSAWVQLQLHGRHQVGNALSTLAVALECGMPLAQAVQALAQARPVSRWRMEVTERADGVTVVNDAYNANPDSMSAALHALTAMAADAAGAPRRRVAVLGEMFELGEDTDAAHLSVGAEAVEVGTAVVIAVGPGAATIAEGAFRADRALGSDPHRTPAEIATVADTDTAYDLLQSLLRPGDVVLLKSSNAAGLRWLGDRLAGKGLTA